MVRVASDGRALQDPDAATVRAWLDAGGVVAYPTESFYGLAVRPTDECAVAALHALKGEREGKPVALILAQASALDLVCAQPPSHFAALAAHFWPGPLTLVVPARAGLPELLTAGTGTIGVRVSSHPLARRVAALGGGAVTATSANPSAAAPARDAAAVTAYFGAGLAGVVDGGPCPGGLPSTVLDLSASPPRILRAGPIGAAEIRAALGMLRE